jgi:hypothetical protein
MLELLDQIRSWVLAWLWLILPLVMLLLLGGLALVAHWQTLRRGRAMLRAFQESSRGRVLVRRGPDGRGFEAAIEPAPEPMVQFTMHYHARSNLDPRHWLMARAGAREEQLLIQGELHEPPQQELHWVRGSIPGRALGKAPSTTLWTLHRLDFAQAEFATRGTNAGALIHAFSELQTRFEPLLEQVLVLRERQPPLAVLLRSRRLEIDEIPALVTLMRAIGRAARWQ